ncbi:MAG: cytochrome C oxidase subunit IV family protein [Bacteroidota bacterium]
MQKKDIYTLVLLIILTITTAYFSNTFHNLEIISLVILTLSGLKFIAVVFQFMEMKKAHRVWKSTIILFLTLFIGIIFAVL